MRRKCGAIEQLCPDLQFFGHIPRFHRTYFLTNCKTIPTKLSAIYSIIYISTHIHITHIVPIQFYTNMKLAFITLTYYKFNNLYFLLHRFKIIKLARLSSIFFSHASVRRRAEGVRKGGSNLLDLVSVQR